jgi:capping protein beta
MPGDGQQRLQAALGVMRRLPNKDVRKNLVGLCRLDATLQEELLTRVDVPLTVAWDDEAAKSFLCCDYNRDGDCFRSPWSNKYYPKPEDGPDEFFFPSDYTRGLEVQYNEVFDAYRQMHYLGGVSSVVLWDTEQGGFAGAFLIHKDVEATQDVSASTWDSIHVVDVTPSGSSVLYKLTSTFIVTLTQVTADKQNHTSSVDTGGYITRTDEFKTKRGQEDYLVHVGRMIEEMELSVRKQLEIVNMAKTREVVNGMRIGGHSQVIQGFQDELQKNLAKRVKSQSEAPAS